MKKRSKKGITFGITIGFLMSTITHLPLLILIGIIIGSTYDIIKNRYE